ncbi:MAG: hypothetical protein NDJ94_13980 [Vicinamibacteria bacterium]|nr:hypothetical protein [Vicinamibacteria bacterium]
MARGRLADPAFATELARRIMAGDALAETELVRCCEPGLRRLLARRLCGSAGVDDVCHDVLCAALRHLRAGQLRDSRKLAAYVWGIGRNLARAERRRRRREPLTAGMFDPPARGAGPEQQAIAHELLDRVCAVIRELGPRDRALLEGLLLRGEDKADGCARLGLRPAQFDLAKFRALRRFRSAWHSTSPPAAP